jgi:hypothetical protein
LAGFRAFDAELDHGPNVDPVVPTIDNPEAIRPLQGDSYDPLFDHYDFLLLLLTSSDSDEIAEGKTAFCGVRGASRINGEPDQGGLLQQFFRAWEGGQPFG